MAAAIGDHLADLLISTSLRKIPRVSENSSLDCSTARVPFHAGRRPSIVVDLAAAVEWSRSRSSVGLARCQCCVRVSARPRVRSVLCRCIATASMRHGLGCYLVSAGWFPIRIVGTPNKHL